jgi:uncharacterized protein YbaP (TraB family)
MALKTCLFGVLAAAIAAFSAIPAVAKDKAAPAPAPAIWRASDADSAVYLFGTFGVLPKDAEWRSRDLAGAIDASETLWFEAPVGEPAAAARAEEIFAAEGRLGRAAKLSTLLGKEKWAPFARAAASAGISVEALDGLKPWAAFVVLSSRMHAAQGIDLGQGVDAALSREAASRGRPVRYFDTIDESLSVLTKMPEREQTALLAFLIDDFPRQQAGALPAFDAWRAGDVAATDAYLNAAMREKAPAAYKRLVAARTDALATEIETVLKTRETAFIALNAGYFAGEAALPAALLARGLKVERVDAAAKSAPPRPDLRDD